MPRVLKPEPTLAAAPLLRLIWLASPALPVGGFSYSEGLEAAAEAGLVPDEAAACHWLLDQQALGLARSDLPLVALAFKAWRRGDTARVDELNRWCVTTRESAELRAQSEQMGRSLLEWLKNSADAGDARIATLAALGPAPTWPVAFALAAAFTAAPAREALLAFGMSWAENMVQAAIKSVPLGQSAGQRVLRALVNELPAAADAALRMSDGERQAFTPMFAILSSQHETQYSRLFRS